MRKPLNCSTSASLADERKKAKHRRGSHVSFDVRAGTNIRPEIQILPTEPLDLETRKAIARNSGFYLFLFESGLLSGFLVV